MQATAKRAEDLKLLCKRLVELCDEYTAIKNLPERDFEAREIRSEIMRLYREISSRSGKVQVSPIQKTFL